MSRHGGFPISRKTAERASQDTAAGPSLNVSGSGLGLGDWKVGNLFTVKFGEEIDRTRSEQDMKGFRHFLSADTKVLPFSINGESPLKNESTEARLRQLMSRLARRMEHPFPWRAHEIDGVEAWENPRIPSGYTYLLQLIAHDLVATSFPISILQETTTGTRNTRSAALRLDTIYGGGPAVCPFAYMPKDNKDIGRTALRLGRMQPQKDAPVQMRDIPRMPTPGAKGAERDLLTEVAIPDPRNDDNPIIAQLVVLFHLLHQVILGMLKEAKVANSEEEAAMDRFLCARGAVTQIYRSVIRNDLLKKLLHEEVYKHYNDSWPNISFLEKDAASPNGDARIPLEFSNAAFRFGHAMVRPAYRFSELSGDHDLLRVLKRTSESGPALMPLDETWVVNWSYFFEMKDRPPPRNLSQRIGPRFSPDLSDNVIFPYIDEQRKSGLGYRDLLNGGFLNLWSVPELIKVLEKRSSTLLGKSKWLEGDQYKIKLREFLEAKMMVDEEKDKGKGKLTPQDVTALVNDPPLAFFVLCESAFDPDEPGLRLGVLGSILVAEVIYGAMRREPVMGEMREDLTANDLPAALEALSVRTYGKNYLGDIGDIKSMPALIEFVARESKSAHGAPGFA